MNLTIFILLLCFFTSNNFSYAANPIQKHEFTDVKNNYWANDEITHLAEIGVMNGYPDLQYRPSELVTRGEVAKYIVTALKIPDVKKNPIFPDVLEDSIYFNEVMSTTELGIFHAKPDGTFGVNDYLTREEIASIIVRAFKLNDTGQNIEFEDWIHINQANRHNVKIAAQNKIIYGKDNGAFDPSTHVSRSTFAVILYRSMLITNIIKPQKNDRVHDTSKSSNNYIPVRERRYFTELPIEEGEQTFIRSKVPLNFLGKSSIKYSFAEDTIYSYGIFGTSAFLKVTQRSINNGDYLLFTELRNESDKLVMIDIVRTQKGIKNVELHRYDRYPIEDKYDDTFGYDPSSYPTGIVEKSFSDGHISQEMIGQAYRSKQLQFTYKNDAVSKTRDLVEETEAYSSISLNDKHVSIYSLISFGYDIVDHWMMDSNNQLFENKHNMDSWMAESAKNFRKRNSWYTADGPYNKMATTVEPLPLSFKVYGRSLLLVKEDRALQLYMQNQDPYFHNLIVNSFINLQNFKGSKIYWETEVTSTYLKNLYDITAPFIDTRFNEQIALFLFNSGKEFNDLNYQSPLRNYADLLISQESKGNIIPVDQDSYYIADYFPLVQKVTTHSSMNHVLGVINLLLTAYEEFGDEKYLSTATKIQTAIEKEKDLWLRPDGDIWYKVSTEKEFVGRDYSHLTLEDLINSYKLWNRIDQSHLPVIEELIRSKTDYLSKNNLGYTTKIKNGLRDINMENILPNGAEQIDAK